LANEFNSYEESTASPVDDGLFLYIVRWVQQACKCAAADFEKTAKNRFDAFLIRVHNQPEPFLLVLRNRVCLCDQLSVITKGQV